MDAAQRRALANEWLKDLSLALKNVALYSEQHPRGREYLDRAFASLRAVLDGRREIALTRSESRLFLDQVVLDRDRGLAQQLAFDLEARGVDNMIVHDSITPEEHAGLIRSLLTRPERISEKGGFLQVLLDEGVASVKSNAERPSMGRGDGLFPSGFDLVEFLTRLGRGHIPQGHTSQGHTSQGHTEPGWEQAGASISRILEKDPAGVARAVMMMALNREGLPPGPEGIAEVTADTLEKLAERALEEHQRDRLDVLADVGRAAVATDPEIHPSLLLEKAGPRSIRKHLAAAVEGLMPESLGDLVATHQRRGEVDFPRLGEMLNRAIAWRGDRTAALTCVSARLAQAGMPEAQRRDFLDNLLWPEVSLARRLELLYSGDFLWQADFTRVKEVLVKLFATGQGREAPNLVQKYLSGLMSDNAEIRRKVADNARYILQLIEKTGKGHAMLAYIGEMFFTRLQDEQDPDVVSRLAGGLAFLADIRLRNNELALALDLMRKAEQLSASQAPALRERGTRLAEALARAGSDKIFKTLTDMLLQGGDQASMEAAEILKRGGTRSATFLIERLAEEENRSHRARLVMLLKEMGKGSSAPFVSRLSDARWYLVRNVVGILGDIGDTAVLDDLFKVAGHGDPRVRREVVRTLARFATDECEERIVKALGDEDHGVQITALNALSTMKPSRAAGLLCSVARRSSPYESAAVEVRQEAVACLGKLGAREALPVLTEILSRRSFLGHTEPVELRAAAARALGGIQTSEALDLLKETLQKDPRPAVREAAQEGLNLRAAPGGASQKAERAV